MSIETLEVQKVGEGSDVDGCVLVADVRRGVIVYVLVVDDADVDVDEGVGSCCCC